MTDINSTFFGNETMYSEEEPEFFKYEWWQYFIIPWVAGFVGYITNVLALEMTFYPVEFWGIEIFRIKTEPWGLFGWQGIIPTKARKMVSQEISMLSTRTWYSSHQYFSSGKCFL